MSNEQRAKLDTKIEREVHKFIQSISENLYDRLNIYVRRNEVPIDMDVFNTLVKTMQASITEFEMKGIDQFHAAIKKELDEYTGEEETADPKLAVSSSPKKADTILASKKRVKSATFSV